MNSTIEAISKRGDSALLAFEKATPTKECTNLLIEYGDDAALVISEYGDDAVNAISKCDTGKKKAIENIFNQGDSAIKDINKISNWEYKPNYEIYDQYKTVFDNPNYYDQVTGEIKWPENDGFWLEMGDVETKTLQKGARIDRYGYDSGTFTSPYGLSYESRSLAPGTEYKPYSIFEVVEPFDVQSGYIAPWFDQPGGGIQYKMNMSIEELLKAGKIRRIN